MKIFYIPDGHRRYAEKNGISLEDAYRTGIEVLEHEVIAPLLADERVKLLSVFCLSRQNLIRRDETELDSFVRVGAEMLLGLAERCARHWSVATIGTYMQENIVLGREHQKSLKFLVGSGIDDVDDIEEVDLFFRSGGELRLSGAPRHLIGNDTQFYSLEQLHPELVRKDVASVVERYHRRYTRSTDKV